ncbi:MAG: hypothetical protein KIT84_21305 [Labilithrix sp.]|nr:hypothetical protein [Labilithrix sp.]MCW5813581.1 hypothetical protein [Labilithrix sp.]
MGRPKIDKKAARAFLDLPWHLFDEWHAAFARERYESDPGAAFRVSEGLREHFHSLGHPPNEERLRDDLETHRRVRHLLDRLGDHTSR